MGVQVIPVSCIRPRLGFADGKGGAVYHQRPPSKVVSLFSPPRLRPVSISLTCCWRHVLHTEEELQFMTHPLVHVILDPMWNDIACCDVLCNHMSHDVCYGLGEAGIYYILSPAFCLAGWICGIAFVRSCNRCVLKCIWIMGAESSMRDLNSRQVILGVPLFFVDGSLGQGHPIWFGALCSYPRGIKASPGIPDRSLLSALRSPVDERGRSPSVYATVCARPLPHLSSLLPLGEAWLHASMFLQCSLPKSLSLLF